MNEQKRVITHVYVWDNQMVMVFDQYGEQMPDYQGHVDEVLDKVKRDMPAGTVIEGGSWALIRDGLLELNEGWRQGRKG